MRSIRELERLVSLTLERRASLADSIVSLNEELELQRAAVEARGCLLNEAFNFKIERALESFRTSDGKCVGLGLVCTDDEAPMIVLGCDYPEQLEGDLLVHLNNSGIVLADVEIAEVMSFNKNMYSEWYETIIYGGPEDWSCD